MCPNLVPFYKNAFLRKGCDFQNLTGMTATLIQMATDRCQDIIFVIVNFYYDCYHCACESLFVTFESGRKS